MIHGVINIHKEKGYTSHDVVAKLRGIMRQKKIGHTGTLDPDATGVLPVCLGSATKLCDMLTDKEKEYIAKVQLGVTTDTQDMTGTVLRESSVEVTEEDVKNRFGALYNAFQFGTPPHAGAAPGVDRMVMLIADSTNIREVIAFPKNKKARDLLMRAPSTVSLQQLDDVHIRIKEEK